MEKSDPKLYQVCSSDADDRNATMIRLSVLWTSLNLIRIAALPWSTHYTALPAARHTIIDVGQLPPREGGVTRRMPEGSPKMTKHQRARRGPASEGDALNLRDASGSAKVTDEKGEVPRSLSKVVTEGCRTSRNPKVMTRTFGRGGRLKSGER